MPANPRRGSALIARLAIVAAVVTCIGLVSLGRLLVGPGGAAAPTSAPTAARATTRPATDVPQAPMADTGGAGASPPARALESTVAVARVIDGDTIEVEAAGEAVPVRYIGINAPERNEPCGAEATEANARLVEGQVVRLVPDVSDRDAFNRLLRYVYVDDVFVNAALVSQGYAQAVAYPPDTAHDPEFQALAAEARSAGLGCYNAADFGAQGRAANGAACDPAYPTVCIPPPPPDLDCDEIGFRHFQVLPPDPHGFDGDGDGIGCQS